MKIPPINLRVANWRVSVVSRGGLVPERAEARRAQPTARQWRTPRRSEAGEGQNRIDGRRLTRPGHFGVRRAAGVPEAALLISGAVRNS
jgi:hypothetical protein